MSDLKVAIVHDWLLGGGAERVVYELHRIFPEAPIYTSYCTPQWRARLDGRVITGYLQHWPFSKLRKFLPLLRTRWFTRLQLKGYDVVISSSGAEAKAVRVPQGTVHINYCHAPTHYYWSRYEQYLQHPGFGLLDPLARLGLRLLVAPLRRLDYLAAQRPDHIIANSHYTADEIKKYYGREAETVWPPVDVDRFRPARSEERFGFVIAGRQTPYKRVDLAVAACTRLNLPLKVIGRGPDHDRLTRSAGPSIRFLTDVSDEQMVHHFQTAEGFIFPGIDDFGIVAVEALAAGTPVIAYRVGGALDYVIEGQTGLFFDEQTVESLCAALLTFRAGHYDATSVTTYAERFSAHRFETTFVDFIARHTIPPPKM